MKKKTALIITAICLAAGVASAIPYLQLDIGGGVYVGGTEESVFSVSNPFTVYALVDTTSSHYSNPDTYYLSVAIVPQTDPSDSAFGTFDINGTTYSSADMIYGTPPAGVTSNPGLLGPHDIFETHFLELAFSTLPGLATEYNSQDNPGGLVDDPTGTLAYNSFVVDIGDLAEDLHLHFDLYTKKSNGQIDRFAPFSHDAQSNGHDDDPPNGLPDGGATLALLGLAVLGVDQVRRRLS